jgi:hypothetical protein
MGTGNPRHNRVCVAGVLDTVIAVLRDSLVEGVYFIAEQPQTSSSKRRAVRKVVIQRQEKPTEKDKG